MPSPRADALSRPAGSASALSRPEPACAWTVRIPYATRSQMQGLAATLKAQGISGTIRRA